MSPARKQTSVPPERLVLYEQLIATLRDVEVKSNFGSAYTALNGNMFTMLSKHGLIGIRLPKAEREAFLQTYQAELFRGDPDWPPAKEYVAVPEALLADASTLHAYLEASYRYVQALKPKPTRKRPAT